MHGFGVLYPIRNVSYAPALAQNAAIYAHAASKL